MTTDLISQMPSYEEIPLELKRGFEAAAVAKGLTPEICYALTVISVEMRELMIQVSQELRRLGSTNGKLVREVEDIVETLPKDIEDALQGMR